MSDAETAPGELSKVDREWKGNRFMVLFVVTLGSALAVIYTIASIRSGDWTWHPFAHDLVRHTFESSIL